MLSACQCFFTATEYEVDLAYLEIQELNWQYPLPKILLKNPKIELEEREKSSQGLTLS